MYDFLTGVVASKRPDAVVIDVSGVGYSCFVSLTTLGEIPSEGDTTTLLLHLHVREDDLSLYGFASGLERELFRRLIAVAGVGPKLALALLSGTTPRDLLEAIASSNVARLRSIKGVGPRTAQRIIVELSDYVRRKMDAEAMAAPGGAAPLQEEALSALRTLGFTEKAALKAVERAMRRCKDASVEALVREALRSS